MCHASISFRSLRIKTQGPKSRNNLCKNGVSIIVAEQINILAPLVGLNEMVPIRVAEEQPHCGNVGVGFINRRMELVDEVEYQKLFEHERQALARDCWPSDQKTTMQKGDISHIEVHMGDLIDSNLLREAVTGAGLEALPTANNQMQIRCGICYRFRMRNNRIDRSQIMYLNSWKKQECYMKAPTVNT
jgi:hypothetical protein